MKRNGRIERQKRASGQHERLQAQACGHLETPGGERPHRTRGERQAANSGRLDKRQGRGPADIDGHEDFGRGYRQWPAVERAR